LAQAGSSQHGAIFAQTIFVLIWVMAANRRRTILLPAAAGMVGRAALLAWVCTAKARATCPPVPPRPTAPQRATDLNGIAWPDFCFESEPGQEEHFFIIGDWGGLFRGPGNTPVPADTRKRPFVPGIDDTAQLRVAEQMKIRANTSNPRYILNIGDNFYWGGVQTHCGQPSNQVAPSTWAQWESVYERIYDGPGLAGVPWMGVLGNHDYGGYNFVQGWDQAIAYTWSDSDRWPNRWLTPAQYWSTTVQYADFTVLYLFVDSNVNDAFAPQAAPNHNMCSAQNNPANATCGVTGPTSPSNCVRWFVELWMEQVTWMEEHLRNSTANWRVVVTHFPPQYRKPEWHRLASQYNIDLIVTGHRHEQDVSDRDPSVGGAAWVVSGGGGGIVSEGTPSLDGNDDQYGFFDVTISRETMKLEAISHSGLVRSTTILRPSVVFPTSTSTSTTGEPSATATVTVSPSTSATNSSAGENGTTRTETTSRAGGAFLPGTHHDISTTADAPASSSSPLSATGHPNGVLAVATVAWVIRLLVSPSCLL